MTSLEKRLFFSLKVLILALILIVPVGLSLGSNEDVQQAPTNEMLPQAELVAELDLGRVEIISMRTATSKTYDNGDGSYHAELYLSPVHYQDEDGDWEEIDENEPNQGSRSRELDSLSATKDTMISTSFGLSGNENLNIGADLDLKLSHDVSTASGYFPFRIIAKFDIDSLSLPSNTQINSAEFNLYYYLSEGTGGDPGVATQLSITSYPLTKDWVEGTGTWTAGTTDGATWNSHDGTNGWTTAGGDYSNSYTGSGSTPTAYGWTEVDIKDMVEAWVAGSLTNHGVILIGAQNHDFLKTFRSSEYSSNQPKLELDYISNQAPIINKAKPSLSLTEDEQDIIVDLDGNERIGTGLFRDPDLGDTLSFYVLSGTTWIGQSLGSHQSDLLTATIVSDGYLDIELVENAYGSETISVNATDADGESMEYDIMVTVTPVNDPPVINETIDWKYSKPEPTVTKGVVTCLEDQWTNLTITAWDPVERNDDDRLTYSSNKTKDYAKFFEVDGKTGVASFKPENEDVGIYYLMITVSDTKNESTYSFTLEVENVNDRPIFDKVEIDSKSKTIPKPSESYTLTEKAVEDMEFLFTVIAEDEDLDLEDTEEQLQFRITPSEKFKITTLAAHPKKAFVTFTPGNDDVGTVSAQMTVTDQDNKDSTIEFKINVLNINDPPNFVRFIYKTSERLIDSIDFNLAKQGKGYEATEYEPYEFKIEANDVDPDDKLDFSVKIVDRTDAVSRDMFSIESVSSMPNTKLITVTPDMIAGREGELLVNITVQDELKAKAWVIINIPVQNTNDPPEEPIIDVEIVDADRKTRLIENLSATFSIYYSTDIMYMDPDGENESGLTYTWDFGDDSDIETGMDIEHKFPNAGTYTVNLTVSDSEGLSTTVSKDVEIIKPAGSDGGDGGDDPSGFSGIGEVGGVDIVIWLILVIIIVIILLVVFMMMAKKKREEEEEEAAEQARMQQVQQAQMAAAQMAAYYQDQNMMAQMQAYQQQQYQQQMMQQYPEQYQQMQQQQYPDQYQQPGAPVQSQPIASATGVGADQQMMAPEGAEAGMGLPTAGISEQPQLPPAPEGTPEDEMQPEFPESPFASAETQTLEEEMGIDTEVAEVQIEPAEIQPETELAPEPGAEPEEKAEAKSETESKAETEEKGKDEDEKAPETGKKCQHCGAAVKEGWFLCPDCKKPLI